MLDIKSICSYIRGIIHGANAGRQGSKKTNLDKCDAALLDKPNLSSIYDGNWRKDLRKKALSAQKHGEVTYGAMGYAAPFFEEIGKCPRCYQSRLEEGACVLLPKISKL